ncbi:MAG: tetratricopeptide repeat protein [Terriglobales bacterium]
MFRYVAVLILSICAGPCTLAQVDPLPPSDKAPGQNDAPPRYDRDKEAGESSSRDTKIDISPPKDDDKNHPLSGTAVSDAEAEAAPAPSDVQEFHPWDPHKAAKDVEVGDFYFKRKNYKAALARYQDALLWKNNDAMANFRMAQCFEKLDNPGDAVTHYQEYLKILPHGPLSGDAQKALDRLKGKIPAESAASTPGAGL